jgi:hypothetical protein
MTPRAIASAHETRGVQWLLARVPEGAGVQSSSLNVSRAITIRCTSLVPS